jgi:hypothetical protein
MVRYGNDKIDEKIIYNSIYFNFPIENLRCWSYFQQVQTFIYPENHMPLKKKKIFFENFQTEIRRFRRNDPYKFKQPVRKLN